MPAASPPPPVDLREGIPAASMTVHGLACTTSLTLRGSRSAELRDALARAWSRCLAPTDAAPTTPTPGLRLVLEDPSTVEGHEHPAGEDPTPENPAGDSAPDPETSVAATRLDALLQQTTQAVTRTFITAQTGRLLMLHAGACADPESGAAVVYVAPGGTGKTTLSRVLGRSLGYLTDETVGITATGRILPYPKPLSIRTNGWAGPKTETSPDELQLVAAPSAPWLRRIVLLDRADDHAGPPRCTELEVADAIIALAPETSALSSLERPLHLLADLIAATGPVLRCTYREAEDLAPLLTALVAA